MALTELLKIWRDTPSIAKNVVDWQTLPARPAQTEPLPAQLHPALAATLRSQGIENLYSHQATSWRQIQAGQHPVIVTGTASGKTLAYNLPVLHRLLADPPARALYLFPTKALAHDQLNQLASITRQLDRLLNAGSQSLLTVATYDGDTPPAARPQIRAQAQLVLSNPDMLHTAILPHHTKWADFLGRLCFVVIDEMHSYRGVFGSHVANVLRRLRRVANFYGASPQFILTSATIANPAELAERLIEAPVALVDQDGAARGAKHFLLYNPPVVNPALGLRRSAMQESLRLAKELLQQRVQTLIFGRTRRMVELLLTHLRQQTAGGQPSPKNSAAIRAYRSGYLPRQRREIERGLRGGQVRAVVATSALELGIDIGGLAAVLLVGYPGTIAATWQQAGRAGRQNETSLAVLIASASPLDQFLAHHPAYFFARSPEQALINPDNLLILLHHMRCAAFELPFQVGQPFGRVAPAQVAEFLQLLEKNGELHQSGSKYFWMADQYPAQAISLRSVSASAIRLQVGHAKDENDWTTIGEVDRASAPWMVHPQAVYLHEGQSYRVDSLDLAQGVARLQPAALDYYTEPRRDVSIDLVTQLAQTAVLGGTKNYGEIVVTTQVVGYKMVRWFTQEKLGEGEVDLPPSKLHTTGYWLTLAPETVDRLRSRGLWSNDPNDYGPNWAKQRHTARARDGYRCQICGVLEQGQAHDVHHKVPFRRFESYRQANRLENLMTLCRSCHRRAETVVRMRSGLTGLATVLGQLAPLFLMCAPSDVGVYADPQLSLANNAPGVVFFDAIPAGVGFSRRLYELHRVLLENAEELVLGCRCSAGCPSCVGPAGEAGVGGKPQTLAILAALLR